MFDQYWEKREEELKKAFPDIDRATLQFARMVAFDAWTEAQLERSFWEPDNGIC